MASGYWRSIMMVPPEYPTSGRVAWMWDTQSGQALQLLEGHTAEIETVVWLPGGQQAITRDVKGNERQWIVATELLEAELARRVGEVHIEAHHYDTAAEGRVQQVVPGWRGWRGEQTALAAALEEYDALGATASIT
jgi:hypothetical protein